jgi:hypothetical protein
MLQIIMIADNRINVGGFEKAAQGFFLSDTRG